MKKNLIFLLILYSSYSQLINAQGIPEIDQKTASVVVIGSGVAGLCAGLHTARNGYSTVIFGPNLGVLTQAGSVNNWPGKNSNSGLNLIRELKQQVLDQKALFIPEEIKSIDIEHWPFTVITENDEKWSCFALIIAMGGIPQIPDIPGIQHFIGKGLAWCPICDGPFDKGKDIAVLGYDDSALDKALTLARFANTVYLITQNKPMHVHADNLKMLETTPNIIPIDNASITNIVGKQGKIAEVELFYSDSNTYTTLPIKSLYVSLGFKPNTTLLPSSLKTEDGYIKTLHPKQTTSIPGLFAAGLVEDHYYQKAANCIGHGVQAGLDALEFLKTVTLNQPSLSSLHQDHYRTIDRTTISSLETKEQFEHAIDQEGDTLIIIDFYIPECPDCIQMAPVIESVAKQLEQEVSFYKIEYEASAALIEQYAIESVPAFLIFKHGILLAHAERVMTRKELLNFIQEYL